MTALLKHRPMDRLKTLAIFMVLVAPFILARL